MLLLFDTASGYALFKVLDDGKVEEAKDLAEDFSSLDKAKKVVKLKAFKKFENTAEALAAATFIVDSKLSKDLKKFLKKNCDEKDTLALMDAKLGNIIKEKLGLNCVYSNGVMELCRGVRLQLQGLISQLHGTDLTPMSLGLSHSLSRYKLKFSPDKVDTMIIQAIGLLDDLDKELNTYAMRVREWYGWHFPEMTKIVSDNVVYAKTVKFMGTRDNAEGKDFSAIVVDEEVEAALKEAAQVSMGTEISEEDLSNIVCLCDQVISLSEYRAQLFDYLKSRMSAIAPNLTVLVGELVGARLISHAGSLINLAKQPASTVQILGAEKALFRALKTKSETPKYGLIYHASLIGQSAPKFKGKISRVLAAKCALSIRVDALGDTEDASTGMEARAKVEARLRQLEGKLLASDAVTPSAKDAKKYVKPEDTPRAYSADGDVVVKKATDGDGKKKKKKTIEVKEEEVEEGSTAKEEKKKKKKSKEATEVVKVEEGEEEAPKKKKKKKAVVEVGNGGAEEEAERPKKKKKAVTEGDDEEKPKKKAKKLKKEKE